MKHDIIKKIIGCFVIPIATLIIGTFVATCLYQQYSSPQIVYYLEGEDYGYYQKLNNDSIGELFLVNQGRQMDKKITVTLDEKISLNDITTTLPPSSTHFENINGRTTITINELKPREDVEIIFKSNSQQNYYIIYSITSESGNLHREPWIKPILHFSTMQLALFILSVTIAFFVGYVGASWKSCFMNKCEPTYEKQ